MKKKGFYLIFICLISLPAFSSLSFSTNLYKFHQVAMGTVIEITLLSDDEEAARKASLQAFQEVKRIEQWMSPWIERSDVYRLNRSAGKEWIKVSPETLEVIKKAQKISEQSDGAFDITIAPLINLWRKAREKGIPPSFAEVKRFLPFVNFRDILIHPEGKVLLKREGMAIDLGGIAKGYAVDRVSGILSNLGYKNHIINAGGDLRAKGLKKNQQWTIGIQHPRATETLMATISLSDAAIATSGDYEKFFTYQGRRYHHILNPKTGFPAEGFQSVTVLTQSATIADAFATAVFVAGSEKGYSLCQKIEGIQCLILDGDGQAMMTPGLKERINLNLDTSSPLGGRGLR